MNGWGATPMAKWADHLWRVTVPLTSGTTCQYKYEIGGGTNWSTNWGLPSNSVASVTEGAASPNGSNVYFTPAVTGDHTFQLDEQAHLYEHQVVDTTF